MIKILSGVLSDVGQKSILYVESLVQDIDSFQRRAQRDKILSDVLSDVRQESARCMGSCRNLHDWHESSCIGNRSL